MTEIKQYEPLWGAWHVDSLIGEGAFGKVYKLHREEFGKTYYSAVKLISIPQNESEVKQLRGEGMDRDSLSSYFHSIVTDLVREIEIMSKFKGHSNIVSLEDHKVIPKTDGIGHDILIRMELLTNLSDYAMDKTLPYNEVIKMGVHVCRALELFALEKITHRDVKPGNIYVSPYGDYKLGDFGVARQVERSSTGMTKKTGTEPYMAPEVWHGRDYNFNVDMYSLGIVMYRFLNQNRTPFLPEPSNPITPKDREDALRRRMQGEPIPPIRGVSAEMNAILMKACHFDSDSRFASPTIMREALEALLSNETNAPVSTPVQIGSSPALTPMPGRHESTMTPSNNSYQPSHAPEDDKTGIMFGTASANRPAPAVASQSFNNAGQGHSATYGGAAMRNMPQAMPTALPAKKGVNKIVIACASIVAVAVIAIVVMLISMQAPAGLGDTIGEVADRQAVATPEPQETPEATPTPIPDYDEAEDEVEAVVEEVGGLGAALSDVVGEWIWEFGEYVFHADGSGWRYWRHWGVEHFAWGVADGYISIELDGLGWTDVLPISVINANELDIEGFRLGRFGSPYANRIINDWNIEDTLVGAWRWDDYFYLFWEGGTGWRDWPHGYGSFDWSVSDGSLVLWGLHEPWPAEILNFNEVRFSWGTLIRHEATFCETSFFLHGNWRTVHADFTFWEGGYGGRLLVGGTYMYFLWSVFAAEWLDRWSHELRGAPGAGEFAHDERIIVIENDNTFILRRPDGNPVDDVIFNRITW